MQLNDLNKTFNKIKVLSNLNIEFKDNKISVIMAPSGYGKSTLLRLISGLLKDDNGETLNFKSLSYIFSNPRLFSFMNVYENLELILSEELTTNKKDEIIKSMLNFVELEGEEETMPFELSTGMANRINIARGLILKSDIILADEPFASLDVLLTENLIKKIKKEYNNNTIIMVTHNIDQALEMADEIFIFDKKPLSEYHHFINDKNKKRELKEKISSLLLFK